MKKIFYLASLFLFAVVLNAQDTLVITKVDVISKVKEENLQIKIAEKNVQAAKADYRQSNAIFLPNITPYSMRSPCFSWWESRDTNVCRASSVQKLALPTSTPKRI